MGRASAYAVEYTTNPVTPTAHSVMILPSTKSSGTIPGLPTGAAASVRVRAQGTHGVTGAPAIAGPETVP